MPASSPLPCTHARLAPGPRHPSSKLPLPLPGLVCSSKSIELPTRMPSQSRPAHPSLMGLRSRYEPSTVAASATASLAVPKAIPFLQEGNVRHGRCHAWHDHVQHTQITAPGSRLEQDIPLAMVAHGPDRQRQVQTRDHSRSASAAQAAHKYHALVCWPPTDRSRAPSNGRSAGGWGSESTHLPLLPQCQSTRQIMRRFYSACNQSRGGDFTVVERGASAPRAWGFAPVVGL